MHHLHLVLIFENNHTFFKHFQVCEGDTIIVEVFNDLGMTDEGTTIHWHGMTQHGTPHMDGVPMVTQCPIEYHQQFHYKFTTDSAAGTHW